MAENSEITARKSSGRPFQKGVSGNPGGRPKRTKAQTDALAAIRSLAPEAVKKMKQLMDDPDTPQSVIVKICETILDRTYGKAEASIRISTQDFSALDEAFNAIRDDDLT